MSEDLEFTAQHTGRRPNGATCDLAHSDWVRRGLVAANDERPTDPSGRPTISLILAAASLLLVLTLVLFGVLTGPHPTTTQAPNPELWLCRFALVQDRSGHENGSPSRLCDF